MAEAWKGVALTPEQTKRIENNDALVLDAGDREGMKDPDDAIWALCWVRIEKGRTV